jgi:hypothetical protein
MFPQGASLFAYASGIDFLSEVYAAFFMPAVTHWAAFLPCQKPFSGRDCSEVRGLYLFPQNRRSIA